MNDNTSAGPEAEGRHTFWTSEPGRRLRWHLAVPALLAVAVATIISLYDPANSAWAAEAVRLTYHSLLQAGTAFLLFLGLFTLSNGLLAMAFQRWHGNRRERLVIIVCLFLLALLTVNALPILVYVEILKDLRFHRRWIAAWSLITANAMLYYFFSTFLFDLWRESNMLYAISAPFKGQRVLNYLKERATWALLNQLSSIFYYIFSFTLFTDLLLQGYQDDTRSGIVLALFRLVTHDWSAVGLWRFTIYLLTLMALILPIRLLLDLPSFLWEGKRRMFHGTT